MLVLPQTLSKANPKVEQVTKFDKLIQDPAKHVDSADRSICAAALTTVKRRVVLPISRCR